MSDHGMALYHNTDLSHPILHHLENVTNISYLMSSTHRRVCGACTYYRPRDKAPTPCTHSHQA